MRAYASVHPEKALGKIILVMNSWEQWMGVNREIAELLKRFPPSDEEEDE